MDTVFQEASRYTRLRGSLRIGQMYRRRVDHKLFMVCNVYRHEQRVQLQPTDEAGPHTVTFDELRRSYRRLET